jgi:hypothetical protein
LSGDWLILHGYKLMTMSRGASPSPVMETLQTGVGRG